MGSVGHVETADILGYAGQAALLIGLPYHGWVDRRHVSAYEFLRVFAHRVVFATFV